MVKCAMCNTNIGIFSKKYYLYPGKEKGSLDITDEVIVCKKCLYSKYTFLNKKSDKSLTAEWEKVHDLSLAEKYKEALRIIESNFDKQKEVDWYNKGSTLLGLEKEKEALKCFNEALFLDTHYIKAWYHKGEILGNMKKYVDSAICFENVIKLGCENKARGIKFSKWSFPAIFYCMMSWIFANNDLSHKGKFSKEIHEIAGERINMIRPFLTGEFPQYEDSNGKLKTIIFVPPNLNEREFVDYCFYNCDKILDAFTEYGFTDNKGNVDVAESRGTGERH